MNRRQFVLAALATAFAGTASGATARDSREALTILADGWAEARQQGLLLLVLVIPEGDSDRTSKGTTLAEWLNHGDEAAQAALGQVVWVCATADDVRAFAPAARIQGDHWMILLDPSEVPARVQPIDVAFSRYEWTDEESLIDAHIAAQAAALADALHAWDRAPEATNGPIRDAAIARAQDRLKAQPAGAYWAYGGCGLTIEGVENQLAMDCGMGFSAPRSARFLYFYTADGR
jgi:hypothetical protein